MPAIQLAELRKEVEKIASNFTDAEIVIRQLTELFEFYSNRTHRINPSAEKPKVIANYMITPPIMRQLITGLNQQAENNPDAAVVLADAMWAKEFLEFRILAARLIGAIPAESADKTIERLHLWGQENKDEEIASILASESLTGLIKDAKPEFLKLLEDWLKADNHAEVTLGLQALKGFLETAKFEELPVVYRLLRPLANHVPRNLRPYVLDIIRPLGERSPQETVYFLRQILEQERSNTIVWLIRNSLESFSEEIQESLKQEIRKPRSE